MGTGSSEMRAYRVAYDGTGYRGFQRQPAVPTVEDELFDALRRLDAMPDCRAKPPRYTAASRTDAGVSAVAQTVGFLAPTWLTPSVLDAELPADVWAWAMADGRRDFHAIRDATARVYTYHHHEPDADEALVGDVLGALSGEHDFHNLTPADDVTVRDLAVEFDRNGEFLVVRFRADGFPRQFVRRAVSLIDSVLAGEHDVEFVERVLSPAALSGPEGIGPAPPEPLVLTAVAYPDMSFDTDVDAAAAATDAVGQSRVEHLAGVRVATELLSGIGARDR